MNSTQSELVSARRASGAALAAAGGAAALAVAGLLAVRTASAQSAVAAAPGAGAPSPVRVRAAVAPATVARGGKGTLTVTVSVQPGYHIYAPKPGDEYAIPTTLTLEKTPAGIKAAAPKFPAAVTAPNPAGGKPLNVYKGTVAIQVPFTVAKTAKPGKLALSSSLGYQTCNDTACLPPDTKTVAATVTIK